MLPFGEGFTHGQEGGWRPHHRQFVKYSCHCLGVRVADYGQGEGNGACVGNSIPALLRGGWKGQIAWGVPT